jgi:peptide-methionine (S)-S-oxide reductase
MKFLYFLILSLANCNTPEKSIQNQEPMTQTDSSADTNAITQEKLLMTDSSEIATLGAGCFWCVEAVFQDLKGVSKVESGYSGGNVKNPTYREVTSGTTGHAEVCHIHFDPREISFEEILEIFWTTHDPTTLNRQGADVGTQYRSAIFYHNETQKAKAEKSKAEIATQLWDKPIVTEITPFTSFYVAEDYHQNYYSENMGEPYCQIVIAPKILKMRQKYADKLRK